MTPTTPSPISDQAAGENATEFFDKADETFEKWWDRSSGDFPTGFHSWEAACRQAWYAALATAPTTGNAPETDDTFIAGYKVGARLCGTVAEAQRAIIQGHGSSWEPLYRKNHPKPASPAASVLSDEQCREIKWKSGCMESEEFTAWLRNFLNIPRDQKMTITQEQAAAFIDSFEIVCENNSSRDPTDEEKFALREFVLQLFDANMRGDLALLAASMGGDKS